MLSQPFSGPALNSATSSGLAPVPCNVQNPNPDPLQKVSGTTEEADQAGDTTAAGPPGGAVLFAREAILGPGHQPAADPGARSVMPGDGGQALLREGHEDTAARLPTSAAERSVIYSTQGAAATAMLCPASCAARCDENSTPPRHATGSMPCTLSIADLTSGMADGRTWLSSLQQADRTALQAPVESIHTFQQANLCMDGLNTPLAGLQLAPGGSRDTLMQSAAWPQQLAWLQASYGGLVAVPPMPQLFSPDSAGTTS